VAKNLPEPPPPPPKNYFVGRWQAVCNASVFPEDQYSLVCIMDIKENGTIVVERYDTGSVTIKSRMIGKNARTYTPLRTGSGTGTWFMKYTDKDSQTISVSLSLKNVPGAVSSINASATLHISDTTRMEFSRYDLNCVWRSDSQIWGYDYFSRIR
jgi:hypothetical protein